MRINVHAGHNPDGKIACGSIGIIKESTEARKVVKERRDLYVLRHTNAPAMLVECCFVDDKDDVKRYTAKKMAKAIADGIELKK